jgi:cytochrome c553
MIFISAILVALYMAAGATPASSPANGLLAWAYVTPAKDATPPRPDAKPRKVPNSVATYTGNAVRDPFSAPDWHPGDHPPMPPVVAHGRKPEVLACGYCHRADGPGGPENASLAGLPYDYILEQMADYKSGRRSTAIPGRLPQSKMIALAKAATDEEIRSAARYFSSLKPRQNIRVIEAAGVPKSYIAGWVFALAPGHDTEVLGHRILEMPENLEHFESRDTRSTFVAYVPVGSLRDGEAIVTGQRVGPPCGTCHGRNLHGQQLAPPIAGRSPSYIARQLYEIQSGVRTGSGVKLMKAAMAHLTPDEMIAVSAYLASLKP